MKNDEICAHAFYSCGVLYCGQASRQNMSLKKHEEFTNEVAGMERCPLKKKVKDPHRARKPGMRQLQNERKNFSMAYAFDGKRPLGKDE